MKKSQQKNLPHRSYLMLSVITLLIINLFIPVSFALESDQDKPATIIADSATLNNKTHIAIFSGHVQVKQGTTLVHANKMVTYLDKQNKISKVVATGKPARYQTIPKSKEPMLHANADTIEYYPEKGLAILIGNASVIQDQNSLKGPRIVYNAKQGMVQSKSSAKQRTTIVIQPDSKN